jgi:hypothetical protein
MPNGGHRRVTAESGKDWLNDETGVEEFAAAMAFIKKTSAEGIVQVKLSRV